MVVLNARGRYPAALVSAPFEWGGSSLRGPNTMSEYHLISSVT